MKLKVFVLPLIIFPILMQCNRIARTGNHKKNIPQSQNDDPQTSGTTGNAADYDTAFSSNNSTKTGLHKNPFGVLIDKTDNAAIPMDKKIQIAKALGFKYMRAHAYVSTWSGTVNFYDDFANAGFKIILNINYGIPRNTMGDKQPVPFPTDLDAYGKTVSSILDKYKPELVVIENEEDNPFYHSGSAEDYINELKTAITICHSKGLKVTNGGLTEREIMLLVYDDLMTSGKTQQAKDFADRAIPQQYLNKLNNYQRLPVVQRALTFGKAVIQAYKTLDLDYVNFHWYEPSTARGKQDAAALNVDHIDPMVFASVVNYLSRVTGKPVITNEFGVLNTSPALITELMQKVLDAKMDYAIFYSGDGAGGSKALQNGDGSLRQTGEAVRDFIQKNCE
ncbi:MAG TPA: hypothetical protein VHB70_02945 [Parafilimonas sp.]|nr:hypothetical protein [Parafilimonas sp.]